MRSRIGSGGRIRLSPYFVVQGWIAVIVIVLVFAPLAWIPCCMSSCAVVRPSSNKLTVTGCHLAILRAGVEGFRFSWLEPEGREIWTAGFRPLSARRNV